MVISCYIISFISYIVKFLYYLHHIYYAPLIMVPWDVHRTSAARRFQMELPQWPRDHTAPFKHQRSGELIHSMFETMIIQYPSIKIYVHIISISIIHLIWGLDDKDYRYGG